MRTRSSILWAAILLTCSTGTLTAGLLGGGLAPEQLRCEYRTDPLGIDVVHPRLNWIVTSNERGQRQTAYRILVASSAKRIAKNIGDLWDSGIVESDQTIQVPYVGKPLQSHTPCFWKVRV